MAYGRPCPAAITSIPQRTTRRHETVIKRVLQGIAKRDVGGAHRQENQSGLGGTPFRLEDLDPTMRGSRVGKCDGHPAFGQLDFIVDAANERSSNCIHQAIMF